MAMVDYICDNKDCSYRFENFFHDPPETQACPKPHCEGTAHRYRSLPGEYRPTNARRIDPLVIWVHNEDPGRYSFPGRSDEVVDPGYHAVEITTIQECDAWTKRINESERQKATETRDLNRAFFDERRKQRRDDIAARIRGNPRAEAMFREVKKYTDDKRNKKEGSKAFDPNFHSNVLSFDSSNRNSYSGEETGWRDRKK